MTNALTPMTKAFEGHDVRIIMQGDEPWWVLSDVCKLLEIKNPRQVAARLDSDEKDGVITNDAIGRPQHYTIISESGLYDAILSSRSPAAKRFRKWVRSEVLPSLRKSGRYELPSDEPEAIEADPFAAYDRAPRPGPRLPEMPPFRARDPYKMPAQDAGQIVNHYAWDLVEKAYNRERAKLTLFMELVWRDQPDADPAHIARWAVDHPHILDHPALFALANDKVKRLR